MNKKDQINSGFVKCGFIALISLISLFAITCIAVRGTDYQITTCTDLQNMQNDPAGNYTLANNIDCSDTINWNSGAGFVPIENFTGQLDGHGFIIDKFYMNRLNDAINGFGIFGFDTGAAIPSFSVTNLGMTNINMTCGNYCAGIAGWNPGFIQNCFVTGTITGLFSGGISGIAAVNQGLVNNTWTNISLCSYNGKAGLVQANAGIIGNNYAIGEYPYICDGSYGAKNGLCQFTYGGTTTGTSYYGMLYYDYLQQAQHGSMANNCGSGTSTNQFYKNATQMQQKATYAGWDFTDTWQICSRSDPHSYPSLKVFGLCCVGDWRCDSYTACGQYKQDCLKVSDYRCGYTYDAAIDPPISGYAQNCSINANTPEITYNNFDLRYSGNQFIFMVLCLIWIICLALTFILQNHVFYILGFVFGIVIGLFLFQIFWIAAVAILIIQSYIGIRYLPGLIY